MIERPCIVLLATANTPSALISGVAYGCEEEGVPLSIARSQTVGDAEALARTAAARSPLHIGIGIDGTGQVVVHDDRFGFRTPVIHRIARAADARRIGANAARVVKNQPLLPIP